jgi:hypothetical protein
MRAKTTGILIANAFTGLTGRNMRVNTQMMGINFTMSDVYLTPIPSTVESTSMPYSNTALPMTAVPSQVKVLILAMPAHNIMTVTPMSDGVNSGVMTSPMSGMVMGPNQHSMGDIKVLHGGLPVTKMLNPTGQNGLLPGAFDASLSFSQAKAMVMA